MRALAAQFLRIGVVGTICFVLDAGTLWLLLRQGVDPYLARVLSFVPAVCSGWLLNRLWTFRHAPRDGAHRQLPAYIAVQLSGMAINYAVYATVITLWGAGEMTALAGVALGSIAGMFTNFLGARQWVFRG